MNIDKVILIDDDFASNYYNKYILEELNCINEIKVINDVDRAREYLLELDDSLAEANGLSIIFLDINLPKYSGFELIDKIRDTFISLKDKNVNTIILTTSDSPYDKQRSEKYLFLQYYCKPLDNLMIVEIYDNLK